MDSISIEEILNVIRLVFFTVLNIVVWGIFFYYLILSSFAWIKRKEKSADAYPAKYKFALLVAAHNEEKVIANIVQNLQKLDYPRELFDIYVIADNCNDDTVKIARRYGAKVFERFDNIKRGKGYSLEWMFNNLFNMDVKYDAVCVFDADNLASKNFLREMNKHLSNGHNVVQGYLDSKNPYDTWISGNNSLAFWIGNRMYQLPRYYLGFSCILGGTGFMVSMDVLKEIGWGATCLTEDLEFTMKLIMKGQKVYWSHEAIVYDEKPLYLKQSITQRKRWMQGHFDCMGRFLKKMVAKLIKERSLLALDACMHLCQPLITFLNGVGIMFSMFVLFFRIISRIFNVNFGAFGDMFYLNVNGTPLTFEGVFLTVIMFAFLYLSVAFVIMEGKLNRRIFKHVLMMPIYNLTWLPAIIQGFLNRKDKSWVHTVHTRSMDIEKLENVG